MAQLSRDDIEFKTLDGITLRGWLYPAEKRGPGIILSAGVRENPCPNSEEDLDLSPNNSLRSSTCLRM